jgi:tRNA pseudouridine55 synthase
VHIESIEVLHDMPEHGIEIRVRCGKGTYIRTLCEDLGTKCGCPAHMRSLMRTRSGAFTAEDALTLDEARALADEGRLTERMLPPDWPLGHLPRTDVPARMSKRVINGAKIPLDDRSAAIGEDQVTRIYLDGAFWGLAVRKGNELVWKAQIAPEETEESKQCE